jgi:hypothetical protein
MIHSQEELVGLWQKLKSQPLSDYASERITEDSDLVQGLEIDVLDHLDMGKSKVIPYTRRRENPHAEWDPWEQGFSASV